MVVRCTILLALFLILFVSTRADFGDYVDPTFECPATVTCPLVCVPTLEDCPLELLCGDNETLCLDGTCVAATDDCTAENTTCPFECAPVACARSIESLATCNDQYGDLYANASSCGEQELADETTLLTFREVPFVFCYCWISSISAVIVLWCFFNQVLFPVRESTLILADCDTTICSTDTSTSKENGHKTSSDQCENGLKRKNISASSPTGSHEIASSHEDSTPNIGMNKAESDWTQTGFCIHPIPFVLYVLVLLTMAAIQVLLAFLTIEFYVNQGAITRWPILFESEEQVLKAFAIAWGAGFAFTLILRWPYSVFSLFLRRCLLSRASHVAIFTPHASPPVDLENGNNNNNGASSSNSSTLAKMQQAVATTHALFTRIMAFIFCDVERVQVPGSTVYVPVEIDQDGTRYFFFRYRRYNYDADRRKFAPGVWNVGTTLGAYRDAATGLTDQEVNRRRGVVGPNTLRVQKPNPLQSIYEEFGKPFYTYQYFIAWSWFPFWYYTMAIVYVCVITIGGLTVAAFRYRQERTLYKLSQISGEITALRRNNDNNGSVIVTIPQTDVVPGDVVVIQPGIVSCDMVLVASNGILIDESALTGESAPVAKRAVDPADTFLPYDRIQHKKHTISAGTIVLECGDGDGNLGVVTRTGSFTSKGELLRDILSYERHQFKFDTEVKIVIFILFLYCIFGFAIVSYFLKNSPTYAFFYGIYVVSTCLPPLLPTVFTVSVGISDDRLAKKRIAVANSEGILVAGKVNTVFFDKTGTLTKQGLDFLSVRCAATWKTEATTSVCFNKDVALGMAVCHNLTLSKNAGGRLVGNSVDLIMFGASGATLHSVEGSLVVTESNGQVVHVVKQFEFDHHRALQSVIVMDANGRLLAFVKGSDDSIKRCCTASSLPSDYDQEAQASAKNGIYQIAMAMKVLAIETEEGKSGNLVDLVVNMARDEIERDLSFVGVINFKNILREETPNVISQLQGGDCQVAVITGDHVLTGIHIAKEAGIIHPSKTVLLCSEFSTMENNAIWRDEEDQQIELRSVDELKKQYDLAITGDAWESLTLYQPTRAAVLAPFIRVFGRCTPDDKVSVVSTFVKLGFITLMCGDGGNDCGALRTAHVGVALSDAEASVVSPFTSLDKCVTAVPEVLKEGRCALASSLASYKFMIMYGQLSAIFQIVNAYFKISFFEWNWIFLDGIWTITLAFALPLSQAASVLAPARPTSSLLGLYTMSSACGILLLNFIFFVSALLLLFHQPWFSCRKWINTDIVKTNGDNYESEVIFLVSGYQFISSAMAFNYGYEFRQGWLQNFTFVALVAAYTAMHIYILFVPSHMSCFFRVNCENENVVRGNYSHGLTPIQNIFSTTIMPVTFRWKLFFFILFNTLVVQGYEYFIVNGIGLKYARKNARKKKEQVKGEFIVEDDVRCDAPM